MQVNLVLLKQLRKDHGLSMASVSAHLGFKSQQGYFYKETGVREITATELGTLAALFGVSADDLLIPASNDEETA